MRIKLRIAVAVALAVLTAVITPMQALAYSNAEDHLINTKAEVLEKELKNKTIGNYTGNAKLYISDIKIESASKADVCKLRLHNAGYLVYDCDLNEGSDPPPTVSKPTGKLGLQIATNGPKSYTYLGYKLTTDRNKAITSLHIMDEDGGYDSFSYSNFAKNQMPGLQNMIRGMKASCAELKRKLDAGSYAAKVAKEYLDMFCVPETSAETTGKKLGDYLLDPNLGDNDLGETLLVLNTLMINLINSMLAMGITDSEISFTTANGGEKADGTVAATYTSRNAITGYTGLTASENWLQNAASAMTKNAEFANVNKTDASRFFADQMVTYGAQIAAVKRAFAENTLSAAAVNYLKNETIESTKGAVGTLLGTDKTTAYDLLTKGSNRMLCLFFAELPDVCEAHQFIDVLEVCATDHQHRLPVDFTYDKQYDIDWAPGVVSAIESEVLKPAGKAVYDQYNTEIENFVELFKIFAEDYEKAIEDYENDPNKPIFDSDADTYEEAYDIFSNTLANQEEVDPASYIYYVAVREYFSQYTVYDGSGEERIPLIDYLIESTKGKPTDARVKARVYPVVKALGAAKNYSYQSVGAFTFLLYSTLGTDELAGVEARLDKSRMDLEVAFGSKNFSIWYNSNKDLSESEEDSGVAMTSRRVIDNLNKDAYKRAFPKEQSAADSYKESLTYIAYVGMGALSAGLIAFAVVKTALWIGSYKLAELEGIALLTTLFSSASGIVAFFGCVVMVFTAIVLVVLVAVAVVFALLLLIVSLAPDPAPEYSPIPQIMLDCVEDGYNRVISVCRYDVATDTSGRPADINGFEGLKWNALYYTKDPLAGSPLTIGNNGEFFSVSKGSSKGPDKSVALSKFLGVSNYNLNFHCYYDRVSGLYLHYFTEDSLAGKVVTDTSGGQYIDFITIGHSKSIDGTRAFVQKDNGYKLLDVNLSPNCEYNTYIAIHTTKDPTNAITDIRAAYATAQQTIYFGDNEYNNIISDKEMRTVPQVTCEETKRQNTAFSYSLYYSKSPRVGDPLLASGIRYTQKLADIPDDAEVISFFGGMPLDFNTYDRAKNEDLSDESHTYDNHYYVYFKSERDENVDYTSNTYLGGMAFYSGSEDLYDEEDTLEYNLNEYATGSHNAVLFGENLTPGLYNNDADVTRIAYVATHNPKRAITEIAVFTGEPKSSSLPQNVPVAGTGYCTCEIFTQGDFHYYGSGGGSTQRLMRFTHAYFTNQTTEYGSITWPEHLTLLPRALYVCGPKTDVEPIKLEDVVFSTSSDLPPTNSREKGCDNLKRLTPTGESAALTNQYLGYEWKSVHDICQYYYDTYDEDGELETSYDIGLGMCPDTVEAPYKGSGSLYIYYRNGAGVRTRGTYVANVALCGSTTKDGAYNEARFDALSHGEDIVNLAQPITTVGDCYNELANGRALIYKTPYENDKTKDYNDNCYLVAVTYTDDLRRALGGVRILEQKENVAELAASANMPLYDPDIKTSTFLQSNVVVTSGEKGTKDVTQYDKDGKKTGTIKAATYTGYATYTAHNGTPINRIDVRFVRTTAGPQIEPTSAGSENGYAEYYAQREDTMDPFMLTNNGLGTAACLCLQRSLDENGENGDYYVMSLKVIEGTTYDGNMLLSAATLGALGCPYIIDFDIAEGNLSNGSNTVVALGVERTSDSRLALKDIRLSTDDLGAVYAYGGMRYDRVNDKPIRLEGAAKDGVYIYTTDGSDSRMVEWSEIENKETVDWQNFDWEHLDYKKSAVKDKTFLIQLYDILDQYPTELYNYVSDLCSDDYNNANDSEKQEWANQYAITNIGFEPGNDCWMQQYRSFYGLKVKDIYWAGCRSYGDDVLPVPVTTATTPFAVCTFGNTESLSGLRVTNAGNVSFTQYQSPAERARAELSASVFSEKNLPAIAVLSGAFVAGLAAAYVFYRKKKKASKTR